MKTSLYYFVLPLLIFLTACNSRSSSHKAETENKPDTLTYTIKSIIRKDKDCTQTDSVKCNIISISYPLFDDHPALNDSLKNTLLAAYPMDQPASSPDAQADQFMKEYESFKKEPYAAGRQYEFQGTVKILNQTPALITLKTDTYTYTGGAHGASFARFTNYDITSKRVIHLDDVLKPGHKDSLTKVAEAIFRKNEGLSAGAPLTNGYFFEGGKFSINDNYAFTPQGINFLYNQYEIKPYAAGQTELLIPYAAIRGLLKPGSILNQFINK